MAAASPAPALVGTAAAARCAVARAAGHDPDQGKAHCDAVADCKHIIAVINARFQSRLSRATRTGCIMSGEAVRGCRLRWQVVSVLTPAQPIDTHVQSSPSWFAGDQARAPGVRFGRRPFRRRPSNASAAATGVRCAHLGLERTPGLLILCWLDCAGHGTTLAARVPEFHSKSPGPLRPCLPRCRITLAAPFIQLEGPPSSGKPQRRSSRCSAPSAPLP